MAGIILSADIGTSSLKAALIDLDGKLIAFSRTIYGENSNGGVNAASWEKAFVQTLKALGAQEHKAGLEGICISGNGPTLVPVTGGGEALPPLFWYDDRTVTPQVLPDDAPLPDADKARSLFLPRAAWLKKNAPQLYKKTEYFISSHEWLAYRLGAEIHTVLPSVSYEPYYWDEQQCFLHDLDRRKFPPFINMGKVMGHVSKEAASLFGRVFPGLLKSGTPIIAGGPDFITALIGTGTIKPGDVCDRAGSSEGINVCASARPDAKTAEAMGIRVLPHIREGYWNIGSVIARSGRLFETYRSSAGQDGRPYDELLAELIPHSGDKTEKSGYIKSGRDVLYAIGLAVRDAIEALSKLGFPVMEMRVSGGQGRNPLWNQLKADISGVSLLIPEICDGELAGNAVLCACALAQDKDGNFESNLEAAIGRMIRFGEVYKPGSSR